MVLSLFMTSDEIEGQNENKSNFYQNISAFSNDNIVTSYTEGLEKSILEFVEEQGKVNYSDILNRYGNTTNTHKHVKNLLYSNRIVIEETKPESVKNSNYKQQEIYASNEELSQWISLSAQPCITCPIYNECGLGNQVSPANCKELNDWIQEEIEIEFMNY